MSNSNFLIILFPELAISFQQSAPYYTRPYARSRMQPSESAPFVVLSNKDISSCTLEETTRLKPAVSSPSIMSDGNHSSDQVKKEESEDISSEESLLSTPTQSHFELPETPKASPTFSIFSYDVPPSKLDPRRTFVRSQSFRQ